MGTTLNIWSKGELPCGHPSHRNQAFYETSRVDAADFASRYRRLRHQIRMSILRAEVLRCSVLTMEQPSWLPASHGAIKEAPNYVIRKAKRAT